MTSFSTQFVFDFLGCEIVETCSDDSIPYKVVSGDGLEKYPTICFNNKLSDEKNDDERRKRFFSFRCFFLFRLLQKNVKDAKIGRGVNLVALDSKTYDVKLTETFDTYLEGLSNRISNDRYDALRCVNLETFFLRTLKLNLNDGDIVILSSFDEMTYG